MSEINMQQTLFGLTFKNPVLTASGTFGNGEVYTDFYDVSLLGGFLTKAVTPEARLGNPAPRIIETPSGMLNAIGLQNEGLDYFLANIIPGLADTGTIVIVNVAGRTADDYVKVTTALDKEDAVDALEINISCPNVKEGGMSFGCSSLSASALVAELRPLTKKPLIVKLTPNVSDIGEIARSVEDAGADAVSLINTLTGMVIDIDKRKPMLANVTGGLSGPAVRPVAVRMVYETAKAVSIPVIGMGGIFSARDALEFMIAGASLVQVGCGMFVKPKLPLEVIDGIEKYLARHEMSTIGELTGSISV